jgi:phage terminase large subunit-like protein
MARRTASKPAPSLGWVVLAWIETHLCRGPGDLRGEPIGELDAELAAFIVRAYELDPVTGRRKVNRASFSRPKGRAKSELAAMLVCAELLGPVRFDRWDRGEPVGKPVRDPFIRCLATEEGQSGNTFDGVHVMLEHLSERFGSQFPKLDIGLTRVFVAGGGEVRPSTAASASKDGGKETFVVADETHLWTLPELRAMHDTVTRNLTKRRTAEPWMVETSTMYQPGLNSVAESTHDYHRQIQSGERVNRGLLFDHAEGPMPDDWDDDAELVDCLRVAYGDAAAWVDVDRILAEIRDPKTTKAQAARYFLNRATVDAEQWVSPAEWQALAAPGPQPDKGAGVALGFDGSESDDATALIGIDMATGRLFVLGCWRAPDGATGWTVPRGQVHAAVDAAFDRWNVALALCDPPYWRTELAEWAAKYGDKVVVEFPTATWSRTARAVERLTTAIHAGLVSHDGDVELAAHVANARCVPVNDRRPELGYVLAKDRRGSPRKIDLAVASVLAFEARDMAIADGWKPRSRPRIFWLNG